MYVPVAPTVIDCVVAPVLHVLPDGEEEFSTTELPGHTTFGPVDEITGTGSSVVVMVLLEQPFTETDQVPADVTVMLCVVSPVLQL